MSKPPIGKCHSVESLGLLDGPGIRTIFFLQGCPLRCVYCHNPDTQDFTAGTDLTVEDLVARAKRYRSYYDSSGGGVSLSGGEPMAQPAFVLAAFEALKKEGISTCLDTSGVSTSPLIPQILQVTDVLLLDIKAFDEHRYQGLTGIKMQMAMHFIKQLVHFKGRLVLRHVMVPGITDKQASMDKFLAFLQEIPCPIDVIEILPYHTDGAAKYQELGQAYPLDGIPPMDKARAKAFEQDLNRVMRQQQARGLLPRPGQGLKKGSG